MRHLAIETLVLQCIQSSIKPWTRPELQNCLTRQHGLNPRKVKAAIDFLLVENEIAYTNRFGCTFLELSYNKPVRMTESIVVKPPESHYDTEPGEIVIDLESGASFGTGRHPTTRLCLNGLDFLYKKATYIEHDATLGVLDIGTGSGILLLAAVKLGGDRGVGLDLDPCAVAEARTNVRKNGLEDRIHITTRSLEEIEAGFAIVIANLRVPTIERLFPQMLERTAATGVMLVSGIKTDEMDLFQNGIQKKNRLETIWQAAEMGWSAAAFKKRSAS